MAQNNQRSSPSTLRTFVVALILSGVCSVLVTSAVTLLSERRETNMLIFKRANVLKAAGFDVPTSEVNEVFESRIQLRYFRISSGEYVKPPADPQFDSVDAAKNPAYSQSISASEDYARIKKRSQISEVYFLKGVAEERGEEEREDKGKVKTKDTAEEDSDDAISRIILPVRGKGLWSTMKGFMALDPESFDILGLSFYSHAETPGLGGEIDNPKWLAQWPGKRIYDASGGIGFKVLKGIVPSGDPKKDYHVDGLAGATLTANGVTKMVRYWFGAGGYQTFLTKQKDAGWKE